MRLLPLSICCVFGFSANASIPSMAPAPKQAETAHETRVRDAKGTLRDTEPVAEVPLKELWSHKDPSNASQPFGTATDRAYKHIRLTVPSKPIIVAVLDTGVEIGHPDLRGKIFTNEVEKKGKPGVDDDGNGYIDDIHGWNFLGNKNGENIDKATYEITRLVSKYRKLKDQGALDDDGLSHLAEYEKIYNAEKYGSTYYSLDFDMSALIGDDPNKLDDIGYGNPDVQAGDIDHGTHCAGVIGALRKNGFGINGQAKFIKILPVRVVPDGDERDKDVANGIRYAVDMGAKVISMSFGKAFSPEKAYVDQAYAYAEEHGVFLVHAAGNNKLNLDLKKNKHFPNRHYVSGGESTGVLDVGASTKFRENLAADFTNYGKYEVDLFAPGDDIYSTVSENEYASYSGTSMATPQVAGIAALIMTQVPSITPKELKKLLMETVTSGKGYQTRLPGFIPPIPSLDLRVDFASLSQAGGVVNAFNALTKVLGKAL